MHAVRTGEHGRDELEAYVRARFAAKHGADVRSFMPTLISFRNRAGELRGVAGIRGAHEGPLYLEQYIGLPIETRLAAVIGHPDGSPVAKRDPVRRDAIVEVGNLAGASCRAAVRMVAQLPHFLMDRRYSWIAFTATGALRQILIDFGAPLVELGRADPADLAATTDGWGRYYETDPRVLAGYLPDADRLAGFAHGAPRPLMLLSSLRNAPAAATALVDSSRSISYGALASLLELEADWLHSSGDRRHALLADNGVPWALADLALHVCGLISVPVPASFTPAQMTHALDDAGIEAVLTDDLALAAQRLHGWEASGISPGSGLHRFVRRLEAADRPEAPCGTRKITYTSGSTSQPKGVCLSGPALEAIAAAVADATSLLPITRHLCILPLATLLENVAGLYAPLLRGATCVLPSSAATGMGYGGIDAARLLATLSRERPHSLILVPELLQLLVAAAETGWQVPTSLQFVAVGGARVAGDLLERAEVAGIPVHEGYGLSECASVVCLNTPAARRAGTVGKPLPHVRVRIDAAGQIHVAGNAMLGYLGAHAPEVVDEIATGDLGYFDRDGFLHLQGRLGDRFITSLGRNVSPEWVESEVAQRLDSRPVLAYGEARSHVVLLVGVAREAVSDTAVSAAIDAANRALPDYARVRRWSRSSQPFSFADGTLTANGRLRREEIHARNANVLDELYRAPVAH
jgi:long-chain acyl-CoA synthetase